MINVMPSDVVKLSYSIIKGTTPTFNLKIPPSLDQSLIEDVCIVFVQRRDPIVTLDLSDCSLQNNILSFTLTQETTYSFYENEPVLIQINVLATTGQVLASFIYAEMVKPNLCEDPFNASLVGEQPDPNVADTTSSGLESSEQTLHLDFEQIQNIAGYIQKGEYDPSTIYYEGDVVTYNGSSYIAKTTTQGNLPTNETYWQLVAAKGDDGEDGADGFSPTISVELQTPDTYILRITNANGYYLTPNLRATVPDKVVMTDFDLSYDGDTVTIEKRFVNIKNQTESQEQEPIRLADSQDAGLMSPADVQAIQRLQDDVAALKGQTVRLAYDDKTDPTAQEIQAFVIAQGYTDPTQWANIAVIVVDTNYVWRYYSNDGWVQQTDLVSQFTNETAGVILGSQNEGQVYAENNGTGSVVGWAALKARIANIEERFSNYYTKDEMDLILYNIIVNNFFESDLTLPDGTPITTDDGEALTQYLKRVTSQL